MICPLPLPLESGANPTRTPPVKAGDAVSVMILTTVSILLLRGGGVFVLGRYNAPLWAIWIVLATDLFVRGLLIYGRFLQGGWKKIKV